LADAVQLAVPPALQRRVLVYGAGRDRAAYHHDLRRKLADLPVRVAALLFGAFLLFTGVKMALAKEDAPASATNRWCAGSAAICA
jgi:alkylation response protein AidB-like acyl-CoA dehydrogenase